MGLWFLGNRVLSRQQVDKPTTIIDRLPLKIGSETLTREELKMELALLKENIEQTLIEKNKDSYIGDDELAKLALHGLLKRKILLDRVKRNQLFTYTEEELRSTLTANLLKIAPDPGQLSYAARKYLKEKAHDNAIIDLFVHKVLYRDIEVSPDEMERYYEEHLADFSSPPRVSIRQIVFQTEGTAGRIRQRLTPANFSEYARKYSLSPEGKDGGRLKPFARGIMPHIFDGAFSMRVGQIGGILKSTYGFHIFLVDKKEPAKTEAYSMVRNRVRRILEQSKQRTILEEWVSAALASENLNRLERNLNAGATPKNQS